MIRQGTLISRVLVVLTLVTVMVLIWVALLSPILNWRSQVQNELQSAQIEQARLQRSIAQLMTEQARLSADDATSVLWTAFQSGEATARVQASLSTMARQSGVNLRSIAPVRARELPFSQALAFRLESEASLDQMVALLRAIEYSNPPLVIERANVRRLTRPTRSSDQPLVFFQLEILAPVIITGNAG
ncbi:type II secretion system protein GspM [Pseudaestuariivita rosea]|uniref:type II secretion system protein GspM n=1 Tax=Pseudaestuariivita rosea TaxID=2763263 RepID=UPI001ABB6961|nr:type II secretion system protein GspM [Pseudaestuariivita rosea]